MRPTRPGYATDRAPRRSQRNPPPRRRHRPGRIGGDGGVLARSLVRHGALPAADRGASRALPGRRVGPPRPGAERRRRARRPRDGAPHGRHPGSPRRPFDRASALRRALHGRVRGDAARGAPPHPRRLARAPQHERGARASQEPPEVRSAQRRRARFRRRSPHLARHAHPLRPDDHDLAGASDAADVVGRSPRAKPAHDLARRERGARARGRRAPAPSHRVSDDGRRGRRGRRDAAREGRAHRARRAGRGARPRAGRRSLVERRAAGARHPGAEGDLREGVTSSRRGLRPPRRRRVPRRPRASA